MYIIKILILVSVIYDTNLGHVRKKEKICTLLGCAVGGLQRNETKQSLKEEVYTLTSIVLSTDEGVHGNLTAH